MYVHKYLYIIIGNLNEKKKKHLIHVQLFKQHVKEWWRLHQQTHSYKRPLCRQLEKALRWKWAWHPTSISADRTTTGDTTAPSRRADFHLPSNWWLPLCRAEKQKPAWKTTDRHRDDDPRMSLWKMSLMSQRESERAGEPLSHRPSVTSRPLKSSFHYTSPVTV